MSKTYANQGREFIQYLKQRDDALESVKTAETELRVTQSKLYDAKKHIEELRKKLKEAESKSNKSSRKKSPPMTSTTTTTTTTKRTSIPRGSISKGSGTQASSNGHDSGPTRRTSTVVSSTRPDHGRPVHPHIADMDTVATSRDYYWKIAEKYQTLPMYQILEAEKKFLEADTEGNGTIDIHAMDKALSESVGMFAPKQLDEIFKEIDTDDSGSIDFEKVLFTLNRLFTRRKTNLPQSIQQNYTKICNIQ